ncbi:MAG TPA: amidohydrolase family protein [Allosphingosinicella sp.]|nr:amidohydrolase family protein [Allosphingosinicella sp.]
MLPARDILIENGRVKQVGAHIAPPPGARILDLSRYVVLPGLVEAHAHLLMEHPGDEGSGETSVREVVREGDALRVLRGAARAGTYLDAGFTTVRDLGNAGRFADVALRRAIAEGTIRGPRLFVAGPGLSPAGGQLDGVLEEHQNIVRHEYRIVRGADDARAAVREIAVQGADHVKLYSNASPNPAYLSIEEMRAIVEEANLMGLKVTAHATNDRAINRALDAGVRAIEHGRGATPATLARMKQLGAVLVLTEAGRSLLAVDVARTPAERRPDRARIEAILGLSRDRIEKARDAGVEVAFGSDVYIDFGLPRGEAARMAINAYVDGGASPAQALRSATWVAGNLVAPGELGTLREGAHADLIAVEGDPTISLEALRNVRCIVLAGRTKDRLGSTC